MLLSRLLFINIHILINIGETRSKTIRNRELMCLSKRRSETLSLLLGCGSISIADLFLTKVTGYGPCHVALATACSQHRFVISTCWKHYCTKSKLYMYVHLSLQETRFFMLISTCTFFFVSFNLHTQYCDLNVVEILSINHWFLSWLLYYVVGGGRMRIEGWYACHIQCIHLLALLLHRVRLQQTRRGNPKRNLRKENSNIKFQKNFNELFWICRKYLSDEFSLGFRLWLL